MANIFQKAVWMMGILCLLQPAIAENASYSQQIESKSSLLDDAQARIEKFSAEIDAREKEKKLIEMDIKRFTLEVRSLSLNTKPDEATKKALNTAQFEVKRAEFNLEKNTEILKQLYSKRDKTREQKRVYSLQLEQLKAKGAEANAVVDAAAEKQAIEKARLAQLEKIKQQEAAEVEKQRRALQAKLATKPVVPATKIPVPAPVALIKKPAVDVVALEAAKKKQQAAEKERLRLAEIEKQKQLIAAQQAEKERLRLAELEKQKLLLAAQQAEKEKAEKQHAALVAKEAEESAKQAQAIAEKNRLAQLEQERLLAEAKKQQAISQQTSIQTASLNRDSTKKGELAKPLTPEQATQIKFLKTSATLPPAESALTLAMARSLDSASEQPTLGNHPDLEVANPIGSSPKTVGAMKYLGNNQYMLELRVAKGKQEFLLGEHSFVKNIPEHFDGIRCLLLVDARNKNNPTFQLVVAGN